MNPENYLSTIQETYLFQAYKDFNEAERIGVLHSQSIGRKIYNDSIKLFSPFSYSFNFNYIHLKLAQEIINRGIQYAKEEK